MAPDGKSASASHPNQMTSASSTNKKSNDGCQERSSSTSIGSAQLLDRVNALRNLQLKAIDIESELFAKIYDLEIEHFRKSKDLMEKRKKIVSGEYEPTKDDCRCDVEIPSDSLFLKQNQNADSTHESHDVSVAGSGDATTNRIAAAKGIPKFWLTVLKNAEPISSMIQEYDEPVMYHLIDISLDYEECNQSTAHPADINRSFIIKFHFSSNQYFTNSILTKKYHVRTSADKEDPMSYEGPEIIACQGCAINWNPGMNVTERTVRRRKINKSNNRASYINKKVPRDSFFHFFSPPTRETFAFPDETADEINDLLEEHFEVGHFLRENLIPHAILFYTGEATDVVSDYADDEDEAESEDVSYDEEEHGDGMRGNNNRRGDNSESEGDVDDSDNSDLAGSDVSEDRTAQS